LSLGAAADASASVSRDLVRQQQLEHFDQLVAEYVARQTDTDAVLDLHRFASHQDDQQRVDLLAASLHAKCRVLPFEHRPVAFVDGEHLVDSIESRNDLLESNGCRVLVDARPALSLDIGPQLLDRLRDGVSILFDHQNVEFGDIVILSRAHSHAQCSRVSELIEIERHQ
jgi:hypothetical protein